MVTNLRFIGVFAIIYWYFIRIYVMIFRKPIYGFLRYKNYCCPIKTKCVQALMIDLGLTDEPTFRVCFMIDRYSFYFSLSENSYLLRILFTSVNISFHEEKYLCSWWETFLFIKRNRQYDFVSGGIFVLEIIRKGAILQRIAPFLGSISFNLPLYYYETE